MEVLGGGGRERPVKQRAKNRAGSVCNRPLPPPPPTPGPVGRNPGVPGQVRSKFGIAGPGQVEIQECRAGSVYNKPLPPPPPTRGPIDLNVGPRHKHMGCIMHRVHISYKNTFTESYHAIFGPL